MSAPTSDEKPVRRRQEDRTAAMRLLLMDTTIASLIDVGYARTTSVEVCKRAGVTRGALLHHFASLAELFAATLDHLYDRLLDSPITHRDDAPVSGEALVANLWRHFSRPEYKAVIELWLAARNEPELGAALQPAMLRIRDIADPRTNPRLAHRLGASPEAAAMYRLLIEAMIGMALGRAITPSGALGHEDAVVALLGRLATDRLAT